MSKYYLIQAHKGIHHMSITPENLPKVPLESLPSLDETAEVPLRNRDDVNDQFDALRDLHESGVTARVPAEHADDGIGSGGTHDKTTIATPDRRGFSLKTKIVATLAVAGLAAAGYFGLNRGGDSTDPTEGNNETTNTKVVDPNDKNNNGVDDSFEASDDKPAYEVNNDFSDSEIRELNNICSVEPISGFESGSMNFDDFIRELPQSTADNLRGLIVRIHNGETDLCKTISSDLGSRIK